MNIIKQRQNQRLEKIRFIRESLLMNIDEEKLKMKCLSDWGITIRYFNELIEVAKYEEKRARNVIEEVEKEADNILNG